MNAEILAISISYIFTGAAFYGWTKSQIQQLSKRMDQHDDVRERLARIETKLDNFQKSIK